MAQNGVLCADMPLRNYSLTTSYSAKLAMGLNLQEVRFRVSSVIILYHNKWENNSLQWCVRKTLVKSQNQSRKKSKRLYYLGLNRT